MPLIMLILLLVETNSYFRENLNFYEVELPQSLKKINVLFKISHRISIQIYNPKTYYISVLKTVPLII